MSLLKGKVVIITGAARSLGAVLAEACLAEGATVIATDIAATSHTDVIAHDVTDAQAWEQVVSRVRNRGAASRP